MFTKPANEIEFSDIEAFCRGFGEGVRVEYKQQIANIPKIVSSFANTLGGIFIIGAKTDKKTNEVIDINGIPNSGGLEEQILQSALTGIYPAVMPEVIILDLPTNPNNVVIIIRVDESSQAPHAIQNSTRVYIRTGSITQPYNYAEIDRIEYMLKLREDSQIVTQQILDRTEKRIEYLAKTDLPPLTVTAHPVYPYRPIISTAAVYTFAKEKECLWNPFRVTGGIYSLSQGNTNLPHYWEFNEHAIVYHWIVLKREKSRGRSDSEIGQTPHSAEFVRTIGWLIKRAQSFYEVCQYSGNIKVTATLQGVLGQKLMYSGTEHPDDMGKSADSEISDSAQYLPRDLVNREKFIEVVDELAGQLLWAFDVDDPQGRRELVEIILDRTGILES